MGSRYDLFSERDSVMTNNISENIKTLFSKMEEFVTTKTVVGEPVVMGEVTLIPLVDVTFGMGTGLSSVGADKDKDAGGGALGAKMSPSAVIVISKGTVQLVNVKSQESVSKLIDMVPGILSKFNLGSLFSKKDKTVEFENDNLNEDGEE